MLDPDGVLRTVKYTADEHNGFQAEVLMNGKPQNTHVAQPQPQYPQYPYGGQHHDNGSDFYLFLFFLIFGILLNFCYNSIH